MKYVKLNVRTILTLDIEQLLNVLTAVIHNNNTNYVPIVPTPRPFKLLIIDSVKKQLDHGCLLDI